MDILRRWIDGLSETQRVLDLGCGPGSLPMLLAGKRVIGVDLDPNELPVGAGLPVACALAERLPFADASFDLLIANHSFEHIADLGAALAEIRRVLRPDGRVFVTVPDGFSFSDGLYRLLLCGGGHCQRFRFGEIVDEVGRALGLRLAGYQELFSSFHFVERLVFVKGAGGDALPRRMRWLGLMPGSVFGAARVALNVGTRLADRLMGTHLARYGWGFAFEEAPGALEVGEPYWNVCMKCGAGVHPESAARVGRWGWRCGVCGGMNAWMRSARESGKLAKKQL